MATPYVALLRGINVGGKNVIPMRSLVETFERMKLASVRTYIQSGNVLFTSPERDARALERRIEKAVGKAHAYDAKVVVRSREEMKAVIDGLPRPWRRVVADTRYYLLFLRHEIDSESILSDLRPKKEVEQVWYRPGVLYWSARMADLTRTSMNKLPASPLYRNLTIRNLNTTKKIHELLEAMRGA